MATRGSPHFGDEVMDATRQILNIGSAAIDTAMLIAEVGREVPTASAVLQAFIAIHEKVEMVHANKEDLEGLRDRCRYLTACVVDECRRHPMAINVTPLEDILHETADVIKRCGGRKRMMRMLKATRDKNEIQSLNTRLNQLGIDMGLAATIGTLTLIHQETLPSTEGTAPQGAPIRKSWYVERRQIVQDVFDRLCREAPKLVALVGESGSGKTTVAAEITMDSRVRRFFSDGIVWLSVDDGASDRLSSLMARLAGMVDKNMSRAVREDIINSCSGAEYIKRYLNQGRQGKGLNYLVVADNVWDSEVIKDLRKTGMWILVTTRDRAVVECSANDLAGTVEVGEMFGDDAELVLKRAAKLQDNARVPDAAMEVVELCGRMAMELVFVGRWDMVRRRNDSCAWQDAVDAITAELKEIVGGDCSSIPSELTQEVRRKAVLSAGFKKLDDLHQTLYMSLAVMPDGHAFTVDNAAILLHDRQCTDEDKVAATQVVENLERWSVLGSYDGLYKMHDIHAAMARNKLETHKDVREKAVQRWTEFISTLAALRSFDTDILRGLWSALDSVGSTVTDIPRQYMDQLQDMDETDSDLYPSLVDLGVFLLRKGEWLDASRIWSRALPLLKKDMGAHSPYVVRVLGYLVQCADKLGQVQEAKEWRQKQQEVLNLALVRIKSDRQYHGPEISANSLYAEELVVLAIAISDSIPEASSEVEDLLRRALEKKKARLGDNNIEVARILQHLGVCILKVGRYDEAETILRKAMTIEKAKLGEDDLQVAVTLHYLGVCLRTNERYDEAGKMLKKATAMTKAKLGKDDLQVAFVLYELGVCLRETERYDEAEEIFMEALSIEKAKLGKDDLQVAVTLHELGVCLRKIERYDEAENMLREAMPIKKAKLGEDDLQVAVTLQALGVCLRENERYDEAENMLREAMAIKKAKLGEDDLQVVVTLCELGVCLRKNGRYDEAENMLRKATAMKEAKLGKDGLQVAVTLYELGVCLCENERYDEAEKVFMEALSIEKAKLGEDDLQVAVTLQALGVCLRENERYDEAESMLRKATAMKEAKLGEDGLQVAVTLYELGVCLCENERYDEAEEVFMEALSIEKAKLGEDDLQVAVTLQALGVCLRENERYDEAENMLRKATAMKEAKLGKDGLQVAVTLYELGVCLCENERYDEAEEVFIEALSINKAKLGEDDLQVAVTLQALGVCSRNRGWYNRAEEVLNQALKYQKAKLGEDDVEVSLTLYHLGVCIRDSGRPEEAEPLLRKTLKIYEAKKANDDIGISVSQIQLAMCLRDMGKLDEADKLFELSSERIETKHEKAESTGAALARLRVGLYAWRSGKQERAALLLRHALSVSDPDYTDVRVVAVKLHKYSIARGIKLFKEEAKGMLSYVLGIDENMAMEAWLAASQTG